MGDHLGTRVVAGSNEHCCRIPPEYWCPGCAARQPTFANTGGQAPLRIGRQKSSVRGHHTSMFGVATVGSKPNL
jgi:hypothetical protein